MPRCAAATQTVKKILREAYAVKEAVTDELVEKILAPGLQPGAVGRRSWVPGGWAA